jgi:hypothetical protein
MLARVVVSFRRSHSPERSSSVLAGRAQKTLFAEVTFAGEPVLDLRGRGSDMIGECRPPGTGSTENKKAPM